MGGQKSEADEFLAGLLEVCSHKESVERTHGFAWEDEQAEEKTEEAEDFGGKEKETCEGEGSGDD